MIPPRKEMISTQAFFVLVLGNGQGIRALFSFFHDIRLAYGLGPGIIG